MYQSVSTTYRYDYRKIHKQALGLLAAIRFKLEVEKLQLTLSTLPFGKSPESSAVLIFTLSETSKMRTFERQFPDLICNRLGHGIENRIEIFQNAKISRI